MLSKYLVLGSIFIVVILFVFHDQLGFSTSTSKLVKAFPIRIQSNNYIIYFENEKIQGTQKLIIQGETEFHINFLKSLFNFVPQQIEIFVFKSEQSKKKYVGDETADFTKPWLKQIFVTEETYQQTLKHELSHVFLGEKTTSIFSVPVNFNLALIEGGAMAFEWDWLENTPHYYSALIDRYVSPISIQEIFSNYNFLRKQSQVSYLISGSFCRYLIDSFGMEKFLRFYNSGNFEKIYGINLAFIEEKYLNFIRRFDLSFDDSLKAKILFSGRSMFERECVRSLARLERKAIQELRNRNFQFAEKLLYKIYDKSGSEKALLNLIASKFYQSKFGEVIALFEIFNSEGSYGLRVIQAKIYYAYSLMMIGEKERAISLFEELAKIKISSDWEAYIRFKIFIGQSPDLISKLINLPLSDFYYDIFKAYHNEPAVLNYLIDYINEQQLDILIKTSKDFWTLKRCFYRSIDLGNFEKVKIIIDKILQIDKLNEVEKYELDLMNYLFERLN